MKKIIINNQKKGGDVMRFLGILKIKIMALCLFMIITAGLFINCGGTGPENISDAADANNAKDNFDFDQGGIKNPDEEKTDGENPADMNLNSVEPRPDYELPAKDFGGYNFRVISRSYASNAHWWSLDITANEENGDPINDAVYQRNKKVEEKYNINITNNFSDDVGNTAARSIKSGSDDYDLIVVGLLAGQEILSTQNLIVDLNNMPYIDLTRPWWDQKAVEQLPIHGRLLAAPCDLTIRDKDATQIMTFSKKLISDYALEDPYGLVVSGKWTFDKMLDMMKAVSRDLNGDGVIDDTDQFGLITQTANSRRLFNAAGEYISKLNAGKIPEITLYSERAAQVIEKIKEIQSEYYTINAESMAGKYADIWDDFQIPAFSQNRALFFHSGMNRVTLLRTMESDFGIIPPPKFDEFQENYYASVGAFPTSTVSVPITVADREKTGIILESLAYEGRYILLPAYYDINLKTKFARDKESGAMIDIILSNRLYDLCEMYNWGGVFAFFESVSAGRNESLTVYWEKNGDRMISEMQKTIDRLDPPD